MTWTNLLEALRSWLLRCDGHLRRRRWIVLGIGGVVLALLVGTVVVIRGEGARTSLEQRMVRGVEQLTGLSCVVQSISISADGIEVRGMVLHGRHGGLRIAAPEVTLSAAAAELLGGELPPLDRVVVHRPEVDVDLADPEWWRSLEAVRMSVKRALGDGDGEDAPDSGGGGMVAEDLRVEVVDPEVRLRLSSGRVEALSGRRVVVDHRAEGFVASADMTASTGGRLTLRGELGEVAPRARCRLTVEGMSLDAVAVALPRLPWSRPDDARVGGTVRLRSDDLDRVEADGRLRIRHAALTSPLIADRPVEDLGLVAEGSASWVPDEARLDIGSLEIRLVEARVRIEGEVVGNPHDYRMDLRWEVPENGCASLAASIPDALVGDLRSLRWSGVASARGRVLLDSSDLDGVRVDLDVDDGCRVESTPLRYDTSRLRRPFEHRVVMPDEAVATIVTGPGSDGWVPVTEVSPYLIHAVLAHEDAAFFRHHGFAPWAIERAVGENLEAGRIVQGASTITMQLAKNLYLSRDRTVARKVREAILTRLLEYRLSKREILELYLNVIEYGPGVYGIGAAARHYFACAPAGLTPAESAFLAVNLPHPTAAERDFQRGALTASTARWMRWLLEHMEREGRIDAAALEHGLSEIGGFRFVGNVGRGSRGGGEDHEGTWAPLPFPFSRSNPAGFATAEPEPGDGIPSDGRPGWDGEPLGKVDGRGESGAR